MAKRKMKGEENAYFVSKVRTLYGLHPKNGEGNFNFIHCYLISTRTTLLRLQHYKVCIKK